nr:MAG TPA: hypothetical protein [Caudoviricetes sp.]
MCIPASEHLLSVMYLQLLTYFKCNKIHREIKAVSGNNGNFCDKQHVKKFPK